MGYYQIYVFIVLGLLIVTRLISNKQFYKLSDEDKLKTLSLNRSLSTVSYIFYGLLLAAYLIAIYGFNIEFVLATRIAVLCFAAYIIGFSIYAFRKVRLGGIEIPYYRTLMSIRLVIYTLFFVFVFFYLNDLGHSIAETQAYEHLEEARHKWEKGDYKSAVDLCDQLIAKDSSVSIYYVNRGVYKYNAGDHAGAKADWLHSLKLGDTTALRYIRSNN